MSSIVPPAAPVRNSLAFRRLARRFYNRSAQTLARELLGRYLSKDSVTLRITETEAYLGPGDTAAHSRMGPTPRNAPTWGPGGHAYVYLCYGLHQLLNVVAGPPGSAVLIRAAEPVLGLEEVRARRGGKSGPMLLTGPGKVGQALALDGSFNGHPLFEAGGLELRRGRPVSRAWVGRRVGIDYAADADRNALLRFAVPETPWVTHRSELTAEIDRSRATLPKEC